MSVKDDQLNSWCFECKKNYKKYFNKELIKRSANSYEFCNGDVNKFILLLRKGIYPYEHMNNWERFDERSLPDKKAFYSEFNIKTMLLIKTTHMLKKCSKNLN